jgi:hypothetical protein
LIRERSAGAQDERRFNAFARLSVGCTRLVEGVTKVAAYGKTVWSWHPLLVSSRWRCFEPNRVQGIVNPPATVTRRIRRRGERGISR